MYFIKRLEILAAELDTQKFLKICNKDNPKSIMVGGIKWTYSKKIPITKGRGHAPTRNWNFKFVDDKENTLELRSLSSGGELTLTFNTQTPTITEEQVKKDFKKAVGFAPKTVKINSK